MSKKLYEESNIQDIANAIREKNKTETRYTVSQMASAVRSISVSGGGGGSYPPVDAILSGSIYPFSIRGSYLQSQSNYVKTFLTKYARDKYGSTKGTNSAPGVIARTVEITANMMQSLSEFINSFPILSSAEYYNYIYGRDTIISELGLVLLGDFSQGGASTGNTLQGSIDEYSAVLLQGIYKTQRTSEYNTCMLYINSELNKAYWTGMKDRNDSYGCYVTFTDNMTCSLSGNRQVIIYGMP